MPGPFTGRFQSGGGIFICGFQQRHTGFVSLLFHLVGGQEQIYNGSGIRADLSGPTEKPFSVPLQIFLVFRRHMALICAILVRAAEQPGMGCDPGPAKEYFHSAACQADIYLLFNVFVRDGIVHPVDAYMVIVLNCSNLPNCQFKGCRWQREQKQLFLLKQFCSAALFLLEWLAIEYSVNAK